MYHAYITSHNDRDNYETVCIYTHGPPIIRKWRLHTKMVLGIFLFVPLVYCRLRLFGSFSTCIATLVEHLELAFTCNAFHLLPND